MPCTEIPIGWLLLKKKKDRASRCCASGSMEQLLNNYTSTQMGWEDYKVSGTTSARKEVEQMNGLIPALSKNRTGSHRQTQRLAHHWSSQSFDSWKCCSREDWLFISVWGIWKEQSLTWRCNQVHALICNCVLHTYIICSPYLRKVYLNLRGSRLTPFICGLWSLKNKQKQLEARFISVVFYND